MKKRFILLVGLSLVLFSSIAILISLVNALHNESDLLDKELIVPIWIIAILPVILEELVLLRSIYKRILRSRKLY